MGRSIDLDFCASKLDELIKTNHLLEGCEVQENYFSPFDGVSYQIISLNDYLNDILGEDGYMTFSLTPEGTLFIETFFSIHKSDKFYQRVIQSVAYANMVDETIPIVSKSMLGAIFFISRCYDINKDNIANEFGRLFLNIIQVFNHVL